MIYFNHPSTFSTRVHWIAQLEEESLLISKVKASLSSLFRNQGVPVPLNLIQTFTNAPTNNIVKVMDQLIAKYTVLLNNLKR